MARARRGLWRYLVRGENPAAAEDEGLRAVLDACSDAVLGLDGEGACTVANAAAEELFGRSRTELVGMTATALVPGLAHVVDASIEHRRDGERRPGPAGPGVEATAVRADGGRGPVRCWLSAAVRDDGISVFLTVRDLSRDRAAGAANAALRDEVGQLRETLDAVCRAVRDRAIWVLDADGHVVQVNRAAEKLLGHRTEEIAGRHCSELSDEADLAAVSAELNLGADVDPLLEITRSGLPNQQDWTMLTQDGQRRAVSLHIVAIGPRQEPVGFVWVAAQRAGDWDPAAGGRSAAERLLLDLDDAETRTLRWQVGGSGGGRRR